MFKIAIQSVLLLVLCQFHSTHSFSQCTSNIDTYSDKEFIDIVGKINSPCRDSLFKKRREKSIARIDELIIRLVDLDIKRDTTSVYSLLEKNFAGDSLSRKDKSEQFAIFKSDINAAIFNLEEALIVFTGMHSKTDFEDVENFLSVIKHPTSLQSLYYIYENKMETEELFTGPISLFQAETNLIRIGQRLKQVESSFYSMYQSNASAYQKVKGIELFHDNDVFMGGKGLVPNQDREYTGGFRLAVSTDYFKARFLNTAWLTRGFVFGSKKNFEKRLKNLKYYRNEVLSYQTVSLGGFGYTPYVRYRNNYQLADTLHQHDRPFGSFVYVGRSKFRLWPNGLIRHHGEFQVGQIGLLSGDKIQAKIHQDVTVDAQRVYGWTKQVGDGGRFLLQVNHAMDFMLFSTTNIHRSIFTPKRKNEVMKKDAGDNNKLYEMAFGPVKRKYGGINLIAETAAKFGGFLTSVGGGLRFSTLDFTHQSGQKFIRQRRSGRFDFGWHFDLGINYRYVIHNTMLEGLGYIKSFHNDPYDEDQPDTHVLSSDQINRSLWLVDWGITFRWRQMTLFYRQTFQRMEYTVAPVNYKDPSIVALVDPDDLQFYYSTIATEHNTVQNKKFYGYGTLGITWIID